MSVCICDFNGILKRYIFYFHLIYDERRVKWFLVLYIFFFTSDFSRKIRICRGIYETVMRKYKILAKNLKNSKKWKK